MHFRFRLRTTNRYIIHNNFRVEMNVGNDREHFAWSTIQPSRPRETAESPNSNITSGSLPTHMCCMFIINNHNTEYTMRPARRCTYVRSREHWQRPHTNEYTQYANEPRWLGYPRGVFVKLLPGCSASAATVAEGCPLSCQSSTSMSCCSIYSEPAVVATNS